MFFLLSSGFFIQQFDVTITSNLFFFVQLNNFMQFQLNSVRDVFFSLIGASFSKFLVTRDLPLSQASSVL